MNNIEYLKKYYHGNLDDAVKRLKSGEAVQYIVGNVDFYGRIFSVDKRVLIPRFETEELVNRTIKYINQYFDNKPRILDMGTGSGCIAITLSLELGTNVDALDISSDALSVARMNCASNFADVNFIESDLFENVNKKYDVIISNPPYIAYDEEIDMVVKKNEPHLALYAENEGLIFYEKILKSAKNYLNTHYLIAFEIGYRQSKDIIEMARCYLKDAKIWCEQDLQGRDRFIFIQQ